MPSELSTGKYRALGSILFRVDKEFMYLLSLDYQSSERTYAKLSQHIEDLLESIDFILEKLLAGTQINELKDNLDAIKNRINKMVELKKEFKYIGHRQSLKDKLKSLDIWQKKIRGILGENIVESEAEEEFLNAVKPKLCKGQHSLLAKLHKIHQQKDGKSENEIRLMFSDPSLIGMLKVTISTIIRRTINSTNFSLKGLGPSLEAFINYGVINRFLWEQCDDIAINDVDHDTFKDIDDTNSAFHKSYTYNVVNLTNWLRIEISNKMELPYFRAFDNILSLYKDMIYDILNQIEKGYSQIKELSIENDPSGAIFQHIQKIDSFAIEIKTFEYNLKRGKSMSTSSKVRKLSQFKKESEIMESRVLQFFKSIKKDVEYRDWNKTNSKLTSMLVVFENNLEKILHTIDHHLTEVFPTNRSNALKEDDREGIIFRFTNIIMQCQYSISNYSRDMAFSPFYQKGDLINSHNDLISEIEDIEKFFPIFQRPINCLIDTHPKKLDHRDYINCIDSLEYDIKLQKIISYLTKYKLKQKQVNITLVPSYGAGTYEAFTNTLLIPAFKHNNDLVHHSYGLSDLMVKNVIDKSDTRDKLIGLIAERNKHVTQRKLQSGILNKAVNSHVLEVIGATHTSGLSSKIRDEISNKLDHPNDLLQCRDVINLTFSERKNKLEMFMANHEIKDVDTFIPGLAAYINKHHHQGELVMSKVNPYIDLQNAINPIDGDIKHKILNEIFDLAIIFFETMHTKLSFNIFMAESLLVPHQPEVWWNIATIINYHAFDDMHLLVDKPKEIAKNAYEKFETCDGVSEYWKKKAKVLRNKL